MTLRIDEAYIIDQLQRLVRINSTNPSLSSQNAGEAEIAAVLAAECRRLGLEVKVHEVAPGRPNVTGILRGSGNGRSLLLNGHTDTVGVVGMAEPFAAARRDGKIYGRGAQDMKGSLAAMLGAAKALLDADVRLDGDLLLTFVVDEEYLSIGTADLVKRLQTEPDLHADAAIVTEPTALTVCRAHRGFIWFDVETFGRAAHGSRYNEGIDANMRMGRFLAELDLLEQQLRRRPPHPLAGPPSLHAAKIHGGREISVYADHCLLQMERRTIPGETVAQATAELQAILDRLAAADETFRGTVEATFHREPFAVTAEAPIVQTLAQAATHRLGYEPEHTGQTFWTDASLFAAAGIDTVLIGPRGHGLHSDEEWVEAQSVLDLAAILAETAVDYCKA